MVLPEGLDGGRVFHAYPEFNLLSLRVALPRHGPASLMSDDNSAHQRSLQHLPGTF